MRILITNNTLSGRAGTELYVRDIALGLLERGHTPIAYSDLLGEVADEMKASGIQVVDRLEHIQEKPDIIHGQHHLETMAAIRHFSGVPAVFFCHGWRPWQEIPPFHPRILQYCAVDEATRDFSVNEHGVPNEKIRILPNFVDLKRFKQRSPLPSTPGRALIFSNYANERSHLPAVREACRQVGLDLEVAGWGVGHPISKPEEILGKYDLIFAKARAALESLATGCAVILCDELGVGEMVTLENFPSLRKFNLGSKTFLHPLSPEFIIPEIKKYNALDSEALCRVVRNQCGLDKILDKIISLYCETIELYQIQKACSPAEESVAESNYLNFIARFIKKLEGQLQTSIITLSLENERLKKENEHLSKGNERLSIDISQLEEQLKNNNIELEKVLIENKNYQSYLTSVMNTLTFRLRNKIISHPLLESPIRFCLKTLRRSCH